VNAPKHNARRHRALSGHPAIVLCDSDGTFEVDAAVLGHGLGVDASLVPGLLRAGQITSFCERGVDNDRGRFRLTFFHKSKRLRLVLDELGRVVRQSTIDFGKRPLPSGLRTPGGD
jgi:hypothetical protein